MTKNNNQETLMQLHKQNVERQKIIDRQQEKLDKILELTNVLTTKVLPKYSINEVNKTDILMFVNALHKTVLDK